MVMTVDGTDLQIQVTSSGTTYALDGLLKSADISLSRNRVERATLRVAATTNTVNFDPMDIVQIETKASGEVTFDTRFYGYVREVDMEDGADYVDLICDGESGKLALSIIPFAEYGQSYVDRGRYNIIRDGNANAIYVQLSATTGTDDPIEPLNEVRFATPIGDNGTFVPRGMFSPSTVDVYNKGANSHVAVAQRIDLPNGRAGANPEVWLNIKWNSQSFNYPTSTLMVEIWTINGSNIAPDEVLTDTVGNIVAQGGIDPDDTRLTTTLTWLAVTLTLQDGVTDIVAYGQKVTGLHWSYYVVLRCATQHNFGFYSIGLDEGADYPHNSTWENLTQSLSQAEWTQTLSGAHTQSLLNVVYIDDAQWTELIADVHYKVDPEKYAVYFWNRNWWNNADLSGVPEMMAQMRTLYFPMVAFYNLAPVKISYWKGQLDASATLLQFAQEWIQPFVDTIDIDISTAPDITFTFFEFLNVSVLDALSKLVEWSTLTWRIYMNQAGSKVFEVRSSRVPGDWSTEYTAAQQDDRSFYSGLDVTTGTTGDPSFMRVLSIKKRRVLGNKFGKILARNSISSGFTTINSPDSGFANVVNALKVDGINTIDGAQRLQSQGVEYIETINASVVAIDPSSAKSLLTAANELIYLKDSNIAVDAAYVVKDVSMRITDGIVFDITCEDVVSTRFKDDATKKKDGWDLISSGIGPSRQASDNRSGTSTTTGARWPPAPPQNSPQAEPREETLFHEDTAVTFDPAQAIWLIAIGRGTPASPNLGTEIAEVKARTVSDGTSQTLLMAEFTEYDIAKGGGGYSVFGADYKVTEVAVRFALNETVAATALKSWSVGPTGNVKWRQPIVRTGGKITVIIKMDGQ